MDFCARYGIQITEEDWPCHHIPRALVGDRGEMESVSADHLVNQLDMRIENMPPYHGDLKGIIEQHFHLIDVDMANLLGKMGKDYGERCTEDYRLGARLTLNEFIAIIIHLVLLYNNYHYMEFYGKSMQMRQMRIKPIPRDLWNFGMKYLAGTQRAISKAAVRYALLPTGKASITSSGILFRGLYYGCDTGFREHWFDSARVEGREAISVSYDPGMPPASTSSLLHPLNPSNAICSTATKSPAASAPRSWNRCSRQNMKSVKCTALLRITTAS